MIGRALVVVVVVAVTFEGGWQTASFTQAMTLRVVAHAHALNVATSELVVGAAQ